MKLRILIAPGLALGAAALLLGPAPDSAAFGVLGGSLPLTQRDFRVFNNFSNPQANDNISVDTVHYPGWNGAIRSVWKAASEWGSRAHGTGAGDPSQTQIGSGGADFDFYFAGEAATQGGVNQNIVSEQSGCAASTFAFVATFGVGTGWQMRFCDQWTWSDNNNLSPNSQEDIQGIATHEFGHALGLDHSGVLPSVMKPSTFNGNDSRSLFFDDQLGVRAVYGDRSGNKLRITNVTFDSVLARVEITGENFPMGGAGEVWFTRLNATNAGTNPFLIATGVVATGTNPNMVINIPIPANAGPGAVHVKKGASIGRNLSNGWPLETGTFTVPDALTIVSASQANVDLLIPGTGETITLTGTGFNVATQVEVDGAAVPGFTVINDTTLTLDVPDDLLIGAHNFEVTNGFEMDAETFFIVANTGPTLQVGNGDPLNTSPETTPFSIKVADAPNRLINLLASSSNVPSILPGKINLGLGNFFSEIVDLGVFFIPASGQLSFNINANGLAGNVFYFQVLEIPLPFSFPLPESNFQSITIVP